MPLLKLEDFDPNYRETFGNTDIKGMGVYAEGDEKIGTVSDILVDEEGHFRYLVVDLGFWIFGKKVLLPIGRGRIDYNSERVYAVGMTREQAENLPEYTNLEKIDYDYEEQVRGVYRSPAMNTSATRSVDATMPLETSAPLEASAPLDADYSASMTNMTGARSVSDTTYNRDSYSYQNEPSLYEMNEQDHQTLKLYEERLIANKRRVKTGEVAIGKHVETETARVSVPIEKERIVIERVTPADAGKAVSPGVDAFREGEVAHMEIYEETPDIRKEAVLREEVTIRKEVERDTVEAQETLRREELDVNTGSNAVVDTTKNLPTDRI